MVWPCRRRLVNTSVFSNLTPVSDGQIVPGKNGEGHWLFHCGERIVYKKAPDPVDVKN